VGGDPRRTVILDNFCWGDPRQPDRMAGLVRAAAGCYDAAVAFGTPFVSGKDSLNNEYRDAQGARVAIPPTLLITALAHVPDVRRSVTMDLKAAGSHVYLIGATRPEFAGSHLAAVSPELAAFCAASAVPQVELDTARRSFAALHGAITQGLVRACHDLSEGGLGVAAAEMVIAGELGMRLDLAAADMADEPLLLFSETPSRFLVEVRPADAAAFEAAMAGTPLAHVGVTTAETVLALHSGPAQLGSLPVVSLRTSWQSGLDGIDL